MAARWEQHQIIHAIHLGLFSENIEYQIQAIQLAESILLSFRAASMPVSQEYKQVMLDAHSIKLQLYLNSATRDRIEAILTRRDFAAIQKEGEPVLRMEERKAFVRNPQQLQAVLSTLAGVDPNDPIFNQFYLQ